MRLTPVYWLLFACFLTLLHVTSLPSLTLALSQLKILKQCRDRRSTWALWTGSAQWRKKNSQRISGPMWVYMHECASAYICVCVCAGVGRGTRGPKGDVGTNESTGAVGAVCRPWQGDETNYVKESIIISLALRRHGSLLFSDSL